LNRLNEAHETTKRNGKKHEKKGNDLERVVDELEQ